MQRSLVHISCSQQILDLLKHQWLFALKHPVQHNTPLKCFPDEFIIFTSPSSLWSAIQFRLFPHTTPATPLSLVTHLTKLWSFFLILLFINKWINGLTFTVYGSNPYVSSWQAISIIRSSASAALVPLQKCYYYKFNLAFFIAPKDTVAHHDTQSPIVHKIF